MTERIEKHSNIAIKRIVVSQQEDIFEYDWLVNTKATLESQIQELQSRLVQIEAHIAEADRLEVKSQKALVEAEFQAKEDLRLEREKEK